MIRAALLFVGALILFIGCTQSSKCLELNTLLQVATILIVFVGLIFGASKILGMYFK